MTRMLHTSLAGKLTFDGDIDEYLVDGFSILNELEKMQGLEVQLEIVGYDTTPPELAQIEEPPADDIVQKLMGGDQ